MSVAKEMLAASPAEAGFDAEQLAAAIDAAFDCVKACTACADVCLAEEMVAELRSCITTDLGCADVCEATGRVLSRQAGDNPTLTRSLLEVCRDARRACAEECEQHKDMHDHCRICAEACRRCEQACEQLLAA